MVLWVNVCMLRGSGFPSRLKISQVSWLDRYLRRAASSEVVPSIAAGVSPGPDARADLRAAVGTRYTTRVGRPARSPDLASVTNRNGHSRASAAGAPRGGRLW